MKLRERITHRLHCLRRQGCAPTKVQRHQAMAVVLLSKQRIQPLFPRHRKLGGIATARAAAAAAAARGAVCVVVSVHRETAIQVPQPSLLGRYTVLGEFGFALFAVSGKCVHRIVGDEAAAVEPQSTQLGAVIRQCFNTKICRRERKPKLKISVSKRCSATLGNFQPQLHKTQINQHLMHTILNHARDILFLYSSFRSEGPRSTSLNTCTECQLLSSGNWSALI